MPLLTINDLLNGDQKEVATLMGKATTLSSQFEAYLQQSSRGESSRLPGIHASEISGCERKIVYSLLGYPRSGGTTDNTWRKRFMVGHAVHAMLQREMHGMAEFSNHVITFQDECTIAPHMQPMAEKWQIHSHTDGMFIVREHWWGPASYRVLLEIKTASPTEYADLKEPKADHVEQCHVYMACLDVPMIWLLYWNKGNQNYTPSDNPKFLMKFNPKVWARLEERFERCHQKAALGTLPDREESVKCEFCAFAKECQPSFLNRAGGHVVADKWRHK